MNVMAMKGGTFFVVTKKMNDDLISSVHAMVEKPILITCHGKSSQWVNDFREQSIV